MVGAARRSFGLPPPARRLDGFSLRSEMAEAAERTIDAQYFILHGDDTGRLFIARLLAAADRGVRVRLLLDDANSIGGDRRVTTLAAHKNIEVRMFNPFRVRIGLSRFVRQTSRSRPSACRAACTTSSW
jgi:putative cardiolipin synthase